MDTLHNPTKEKKYKIRIQIGQEPLTFNPATIIFEDDSWIEFSDKYDSIFKYNKDYVVYMEELK